MTPNYIITAATDVNYRPSSAGDKGSKTRRKENELTIFLATASADLEDRANKRKRFNETSSLDKDIMTRALVIVSSSGCKVEVLLVPLLKLFAARREIRQRRKAATSFVKIRAPQSCQFNYELVERVHDLSEFNWRLDLHSLEAIKWWLFPSHGIRHCSRQQEQHLVVVVAVIVKWRTLCAVSGLWLLTK